jgi:hypothetical protein
MLRQVLNAAEYVVADDGSYLFLVSALERLNELGMLPD